MSEQIFLPNSTEEEMLLSVNSTLENFSNTSLVKRYTSQHHLIIYLNTWILGPLILFGCSGNILNLIVLLHKTMRSRTNYIFAVMAVSDLLFLTFHIPYLFFYWGPLMNSSLFRKHSYLVAALNNWFSATSIWMMTYATLERVQVINTPFRSSNRRVTWKFILTLFIVTALALAFTLVHFMRWDPPENNYLNKAILVYMHAFFVVLGPLVLCTYFNYKLVNTLKLNNKSWNALDDTQTHQQSVFQSRARVEKKVTNVVCVIITSFVVCNVPGAVLYVYRELTNSHDLRFNSLAAICNTLAITGKVLNFVLFCLTSEHFRKLLKTRCIACKPLHVRMRRSSWRSQKTLSVPLDIMSSHKEDKEEKHKLTTMKSNYC